MVAMKKRSSREMMKRLERLKLEVEALGGICGEADPQFAEQHPEMLIAFYERVLATEEELNGSRKRAN